MDSADSPREAPVPREAPAPAEAVTKGDEDPKWPARYGLWAYIAAVIAPIITFGNAVAPSLIFAWDEQAFEAVAFLLIIGVQAAISILAAIGFASVAQTLSRRQFGLRKVKIRKAIKWIFIGILIYLWFDILISIFVDAGGESETDIGVLGFIALGIVLIVFAPISEEFLFRGFIYQAFRNRMGVVFAALLSSAMFGILHAGYGWQAIPAATLFGIAACVIFQKTRSLYPGMALHAMHNGVIFVLIIAGL